MNDGNTELVWGQDFEKVSDLLINTQEIATSLPLSREGKITQAFQVNVPRQNQGHDQNKTKLAT